MATSSPHTSIAVFLRRVGVLVFLTVASPIEAQVQVRESNYGPGEYGNYRRRLVELMGQARALTEEIAAIGVQSQYCSAQERRDDGQALVVARKHLDALRAAYRDFKYETNRLLQRKSIADQFQSAGTANGPQFWKEADADIVNHPTADLNAADKIWRVSRVVDCSNTRRTETAVQPPRTPTPPPRTNPLVGLTRPDVPPHAAVPALPPPFCTYRELWAWHDANLRPQMDRYLNAGWALLLYAQRVADGIERARSTRDADALRAMQGELDWVDKSHRATDANYWELARLRDRLTVIDCTRRDSTRTDPTRTQPTRTELTRPDTTRPQPTRPDPIRAQPTRTEPTRTEPPRSEPTRPPTGGGTRTGMNWRLGAGIEYAGYPDFKRVAGDQLYSNGASGKSGTIGYGVSVGVDYKRLQCSLSGHYNSLSYEQTYSPPEVNRPTMSTGTVDGQFYDASCGPRFRLGGLRVAGFFGMTYAINELAFTDTYSNGVMINGRRELQNWKSHGGFAIDVPIDNRFGLRFDVTHTLGGWSGDADRNTRLGVGVQYRPSGFPLF